MNAANDNVIVVEPETRLRLDLDGNELNIAYVSCHRLMQEYQSVDNGKNATLNEYSDDGLKELFELRAKLRDFFARYLSLVPLRACDVRQTLSLLRQFFGALMLIERVGREGNGLWMWPSLQLLIEGMPGFSTVVQSELTAQLEKLMKAPTLFVSMAPIFTEDLVDHLSCNDYDTVCERLLVGDMKMSKEITKVCALGLLESEAKFAALNAFQQLQEIVVAAKAVNKQLCV